MAVKWKSSTEVNKGQEQPLEATMQELAEIPEAPLPPPPKPALPRAAVTSPTMNGQVVLEEQTAAVPAQTNLEDAFQDMFKTSQSGAGEEELLRIASQFSLQVTMRQMKCLVYLLQRAILEEKNKRMHNAARLREFVSSWLLYKQQNNSDIFVMKALEHISLRHFINENSMKINIDKG